MMDIHQSIHDGILTRCPTCYSKHFTKKVSLAGIQFKGSGFYSTDSKRGYEK
jgi:predicted nucleic acid-binding Zn ribbon protein